MAFIVFFAIAGFFCAFWLIGRYKITLWPFACGFQQLYDLPCPTCGMTHSVLAFARGDIILSFYYQPASALFCLLAVVTAFFAFIMAVFGIYSPSFERRLALIKLRYIFAVVLTIFAAGWAVTLIRAAIQHSSN